MRRINISIWVAVVGVILLLASCDTMSSSEYNIRNMTSDTVTVSFYQEIMTSPYSGYDVHKSDSVTTHYDGSDSIYVAMLAPNQYLTIHREWEGLYREEHIVHAWKYISSITVGDVELEPSKWNNEAAWHHRTKGGGKFAKEESHYYDLFLRDQ